MNKNYLIPLMLLSGIVSAQHVLTGKVVDAASLEPVAGASVASPSTKTVVLTDAAGNFSLRISDNAAVLTISSASYTAANVSARAGEPLTIRLQSRETVLDEVSLYTGYQKIPKERATGAFSAASAKQLSTQITTNIIDRLPAIVSGVTVDNGTGDRPVLMVRGLSTINGPRAPLVVLDDFPYEGDLSNINPEIVESVTVLKDAAASSIWGARAANGVIVINTKKGRFSRPLSVQLTMNTTLAGRPDLDYLRQMSSSDFIDVEQVLFARGFYNNDITSPLRPVLTPVVDILNREKNGFLTAAQATAEIDRLRTIDVRDQYRRYMYQPLQNQQYALNLSGGSQNSSWQAGFGMDDNTGNLNEKFKRMSARLHNSWKPAERLTVSTGITFTDSKSRSGKSGYGSISMTGNWRVPYMEFANQAGEPIPLFMVYNQRYKEGLASSGLLDWNFYPLTDWQHNTTVARSTEILLNTGLEFRIVKGLTAEGRYGYQRTYQNTDHLADIDSYEARDFVNRFAQLKPDGSVQFIVPKGGILDRSKINTSVNNLRGQLNYAYSGGAHSVSALAGAESRVASIAYDDNRHYGYDPEMQRSGTVDFTKQYPTFVTGSPEFILNGQFMKTRNNRFVSLYGNAAYTYLNKYTVSGSARRDASNLFGLHTNDQWNPFWSAGLSWKISAEKFYPLGWLPDLKLRSSYGFNGNIDPSMVAATTIVYDAALSTYTGTGTARIDNFFNPNLRWETSRTLNIALDFSALDNRISGSVDFFTKKGSNLFGTAPLDYTTGIRTLLMNVAGMKGTGVDIVLKSENIRRPSWGWTTKLNFSTYRDEVTEYYLQNTFANGFVSANGRSVPVSGTPGLPVYGIFAYKWAGLNPETGNPRGYLNGEISENYAAITGSEKGIEDLQYFG